MCCAGTRMVRLKRMAMAGSMTSNVSIASLKRLFKLSDGHVDVSSLPCPHISLL